MEPESCAVHTSGRTCTLYNEDCISGMRDRLGRGSVSVMVTSPPYNLGIRYRAYDDTIPRRQYLDWLEEWAGAAREMLHERGSLFLNIGTKPSDPTVPFEVLGRVGRHFRLQNVIHWIKSSAVQTEDVGDYPGLTQNVAIGHFKPINSQRFLNDCHEYIFHLTKNGDVQLDRLAIWVEYQDKSNVGRWKAAKDDRRCRGNTWFVPYKTIKSRDRQRPHPATFPVKIPRMCILLHGLNRAELVVDPFLGIGHAALASIELGVDFVGFEIDPIYFGEAGCAAARAARAQNERESSGMGQVEIVRKDGQDITSEQSP